MAKKYIKSCRLSLITKEIQIKTTMRYHLTPAKMAIIKKHKTTSVGEDVEELKPLYTVCGNAKWCTCLRKQYRDSSKNELPYDPAI